MFGYIAIDPLSLPAAEKDRYQRYYCGLCRSLSRYGRPGRAALSYDMTFVALLLSALYASDEKPLAKRCVLHPLRKGDYVHTAALDYAADINILLAYYQALDDWHDDKNYPALLRSRQFFPLVNQLKAVRTRQYETITACITRLGELEQKNELNPDIPANCFGVLMGEIMVMQEDAFSPVLRRMGAALGRFVYLLDAANDRRQDILKKRYNPLITQPHSEIETILMLHIGECVAEFDTLPIVRDAAILRNILYAGVWTRYKLPKEKRVRNGDYCRSAWLKG